MSLYDGKLDNNKIMGQFYIMLIVEKLANITISCVLDWIGIQVYWNRDNPDDSIQSEQSKYFLSILC
jgi:hypothetical protein